MKRKPRIGDAKRICEELGARSVVVLAFEGDKLAAVSYGETKAECASTGRTLDAIYDALMQGRLPAPDVR